MHGNPHPLCAPKEVVEARHREVDARVEVVVVNSVKVVEQARLSEQVQVDDENPHGHAGAWQQLVEGVHNDNAQRRQ